MLVADHDELFQLARLTMQAVEAPDHHAVTQSELDVLQQALIFGPRLLCVVCAPIIIDIHLSDAPASSRRLRKAVGLLTLDAEALTGRVV